MEKDFKIKFPLDDGFTKNKKISDLVYTWLYYNSFYNKKWNKRYIEKDTINISELSKELGISRPSLYNYIDYLLAYGYLIENEDFDSYVIPDIAKKYILVNSNILHKLLSTKQKNIIKSYCILFKYYKSVKTDAYFTQKSLLEAIGYTNDGGQNFSIIKNIINKLVEFKLLKYSTEYGVNDFASRNNINYMK
ncbi:MAG: helix-turn-helix domain-containing protein [Clostridia bacterium]|nr:helix-turn-helix domain-containing protein [Clostridia bacterium]